MEERERCGRRSSGSVVEARRFSQALARTCPLINEEGGGGNNESWVKISAPVRDQKNFSKVEGRRKAPESKNSNLKGKQGEVERWCSLNIYSKGSLLWWGLETEDMPHGDERESRHHFRRRGAIQSSVRRRRGSSESPPLRR